MTKKKKSSGLLKSLLISAMSFGIGATVFWVWTTSQAKKASGPEVATIAPVAGVLARQQVWADPIFLDIAPFTVTLRNDHESRVVYAGMTLHISDEASKKRLERYLPVVRSRILFVLNGMDPERLNDNETLVTVQNRIKASLCEPIAPEQLEQHVDNVLFTAFVVQ